MNNLTSGQRKLVYGLGILALMVVVIALGKPSDGSPGTGGVVSELREKYSSVKDLGVKHALFYVLIGAKMPAILVETSFVSNKQEEQRLNDPKYQDMLSEGMVQGIRDFVEERQALAR